MSRLHPEERRLRVLEAIAPRLQPGWQPEQILVALDTLNRWVCTGDIDAERPSQGGDHAVAPAPIAEATAEVAGPALVDTPPISRPLPFQAPNDFRVGTGHARLLRFLHDVAAAGGEGPANPAIAKGAALAYGTVGAYMVQLVKWGHLVIDRSGGPHSQRRRFLLTASGLQTAPLPDPAPRRQPKAPKATHDTAQRRFGGIAPTPAPGLPADHPAVVEGRTLFPNRRVAIADADHVLKDGHNNRKIGRMVQKGPWRGMPIVTLTLEERATCPRSCHHWLTCYGSGMQWSPRHEHGPALVAKLNYELAALQRAHPLGFVVRLHVLGDFYDLDYALQWLEWMDRLPALHVYGYTAHAVDSKVGDVIAHANSVYPLRWRILFSVPLGAPFAPGQAVTMASRDDFAGRSVTFCPAQGDEGLSCGNCALCWNPEATLDRSIAFLQHGHQHLQRRPAPPAELEQPDPAPSDDVPTVVPAVAEEPQTAAGERATPPPAAEQRRKGWNGTIGTAARMKSAKAGVSESMREQIDRAVAAGKLTRVEPAVDHNPKAAGVPAFPSRNSY